MLDHGVEQSTEFLFKVQVKSLKHRLEVVDVDKAVPVIIKVLNCSPAVIYIAFAQYIFHFFYFIIYH